MSSVTPEKSLAEVAEFQRGLTYAKSDEVATSNTVVLRATNIDIKTNTLDLSELRYISDKVFVPSPKMVRQGSLLICTASGSKSHLGKVALIDQTYNFAFGGFMGMLTPHPEVLPKYLFYSLTSPRYKKFIDDLADGANINNLKFSDLGRFKLPVPPMAEQKRIVASLDQMCEAIDTAKANSEKAELNAQELFDSYLGRIFARSGKGWVSGRLASFCRDITVGHVGSMAKRYVESGIPFLRSQNIRPFNVSLTNVVYIDEAFHAELSKSKLAPNDVAIVRTGYPGTAAVIPESLKRGNCADLVIVRPLPSLNSHFLAAFFNSSYGKSLVGGKLVGAAQKHFNVTAAKEATLHVPPLEQQNEIVEQIAVIRAEAERLAGLYHQKSRALEALRESTLDELFDGIL